jgi:glucokinase
MMNKDTMLSIGIDLGGTKIAGAVFDKEGNILCRTAHLLEDRQGHEVGQLVTQTIDELLQRSGTATVEAIGVCVPGISDSKTRLVWAPNIAGWESYPLQKEIEDHIHNQSIPVAIDSDRTCYILGETWKGAAKGIQNAVFIAVGTGIGMGILVDGRILHGHADIVGAAGWLALDTPYEDDYVQYGCFESNASGNGIARCAQRILNDPTISSHEVFEAWEQQNPVVLRIIDKAVKMWGMAAANIVSLLNPEMIVWGGGVFGPAAQLLDRIYEEACLWAQPIAIQQVKFRKSELSGDAGLYGAGRLAILELK